MATQQQYEAFENELKKQGVKRAYNFYTPLAQQKLSSGQSLFNEYAPDNTKSNWNAFAQAYGGANTAYNKLSDGTYGAFAPSTPPATDAASVPGTTGTTGGGTMGGYATTGSGGTTGGSYGGYGSAEDYITQLYNSQNAANVAALEGAFKQNQNTLTAELNKVPNTYNTARNAAASQSAIQKMEFNEYAASSGLNTGTAGQAQLSMGNALTSNLSSLSQAQADAESNLRLELANLEVQYKSDLAQAQAEGDANKIAALLEQYQIDQSNAIQQAQFEAQMQLSRDQMATSEESVGFERALYIAEFIGDYSGMSAYGWTPEQITAANAQWQVAQTPTYTYSGGSGGGGVGSASGDIYADILASGLPPSTYLAMYGDKYGISASLIDDVAADYNKWLKGQSSSSPFYEATGSNRYTSTGSLFSQSGYNSFAYNLMGYRSNDGKRAAIQDAQAEGKITEAQAMALMDQFGIEY